MDLDCESIGVVFRKSLLDSSFTLSVSDTQTLIDAVGDLSEVSCKVSLQENERQLRLNLIETHSIKFLFGLE